MGPSTPASTTQVQKVELPAWVDGASQANYQLAGAVADRPYASYQGKTFAPLSAGEKSAGGFLQSGRAGSDTAYTAAARALNGLGGYQPGQIGGGFLAGAQPGAAPRIAAQAGVGNVAAQRFNGAQLGGYLNPYTGAVVDTTLDGMRDNLARSSQATDDAARGAGAWGSSRSGVQQAVLASQGAKDMASTEAGLRSAAYEDAAGRLQSDNASALQAAMSNQQKGLAVRGQDLDRLKSNQSSALQTTQQKLEAAGMRLDAAKANQTAGIAGANIRLGAGTNMTALGDAIGNTAGKNALLSTQLGANNRSVQQTQYDQNAAKWERMYDAPLTALNTRLAALGMSPYGKTTSTNETRRSESSSSPFLTGIGAAASLLPLMFSDPKLKTNVRTEGTTDAGVPLKSYEHKGFLAKQAPGRHFGVMADELERVDPAAVHRVKAPDGKTYRAVDYSRVGRGFLTRAA